MPRSRGRPPALPGTRAPSQRVLELFGSEGPELSTAQLLAGLRAKSETSRRSKHRATLAVTLHAALNDLIRADRVERVRHGVYRARPGWALYALHAEAARRASEMVAHGLACPSVSLTPLIEGKAYELAYIAVSPFPPRPPEGKAPIPVERLLRQLQESAVKIARDHPEWLESAMKSVLQELLRDRRDFLFVTPLGEHRPGGRSVLRVDG